MELLNSLYLPMLAGHLIAGQFSASGFLIAAKSIFRFNEAKENNNQKAEYFLLGTLISFTLAIIVVLSITEII